MVKFKFIGKDRTFKNVKMGELIGYQEEMVKEINAAKTAKDSLLAIGNMVSNLLEKFEPEEILEAESDEMLIAQGLHILIPYYKGGRNIAEINRVTREIIDAGTDANIAQMRMNIFQ